MSRQSSSSPHPWGERINNDRKVVTAAIRLLDDEQECDAGDIDSLLRDIDPGSPLHSVATQTACYLSMKLDDWASTIAFRGGWVGADVRPGESKPLCWWRSKNRIRILHADLSIVDADAPPASKTE